MIRFVIALMFVVACLVAVPAPVQAGPLARIAARIRHPFNGNGVPVVRRVTGRGSCAGSCP